MNPEQPKNNLIAVGLGLVLLAHLFLFLPMAIFDLNEDEFVTSFWGMASVNTIPALGLFVVLTILGMSLRGHFYRRYLVFLAILGLLVWVQGSMLSWDYGVLDGKPIDWSKDNWRGWVDITLWLVTLIGGIIFFRPIGKKVIEFSFLVFGLQLLLFVYVLSTDFDKYANKASVDISPEALEQVYKFSSKHNIVHLFVDGFQADARYIYHAFKPSFGIG